MIMRVLGMACLGSFGAGPEQLCAGLERPLRAALPDGRAAKTDCSALRNFFEPRALRQLDHFSRMALLCARAALDDAEAFSGTGAAKDTEKPSGSGATGIVLASGYGPAAPTFDFLDSLLAHGELMASPLAFSHSVHNIPAAILAIKLGIAGPCATICQLECPVAAALLVARDWLAEGRVERVLFGALDEHTPLLARVSARLAGQRRAEGRPGARAALPLAEGAAFFCLGADEGAAARGRITEVFFTRKSENPGTNGALLLSGYPQESALPGALRAASAYGKLPVAQALDMALALHAPGASGRETLCLSAGPHGERGGIRIESLRPESGGRS